MRPVDVVAFGGVSALGRGRAAVAVGAPGAVPKTAIVHDSEFSKQGLRRPLAARVQGLESKQLESKELESHPIQDRAFGLLEEAALQLERELCLALPDWQTRRIGVIVGTSGGGMPSMARALYALDAGETLPKDLARVANYFGPLLALRAFTERASRFTQVLSACASSTLAIGVGCRWLEAGEADLVIAGGYDALSLFIAAGFEALGATSAAPPAPFRVERSGMVLGEGAGLVALMPSGTTPGRAFGTIVGFGASSDAVHVTAPDREGRGLERAIRKAISDAGVGFDAIDLVSAHATATPFNDAAEAGALERVLGAHARRVTLHPMKAVLGHTLGAAGALETMAALGAMQAGILPGSVGSGAIMPELSARVLERNAEGTPAHCLKLSSAFGGANAALLLARDAPLAEPRPDPKLAREVRLMVHGVGHPQPAFTAERVAQFSRLPPGKLRFDPLSELVLSAIADLLTPGKSIPADAGVIVGSSSSTLAVNRGFATRLRQHGVGGVPPRVFPATSPNLCAGIASIVYGLHGPSFSVCSGRNAPLEALRLAADLIKAGELEDVFVVAAECVDQTVRSLWEAAGWPVPLHGATAVWLSVGGDGPVLDLSRLGELEAEGRRADGQLGRPASGFDLLGAVAACRVERAPNSAESKARTE